jgi:hypothetical protein
MFESDNPSFRASGAVEQSEWMASAFHRSPMIGQWALPDIFEDSVAVLAFRPGGP